MPTTLITALVYTDSDLADRALREIALALIERGRHLAGLVQHNQPRPGRSRCDMVLEELSSGELVAISQDRGPLARGCALDIGQLLSAMELVRTPIAAGPDLVILNKFGKTEAEGGGFRDIIADVIARGIPLLMAVPWRNIDSWRLFAGDFAREIQLTDLPEDKADLIEILDRELVAPLSATVHKHKAGTVYGHA